MNNKSIKLKRGYSVIVKIDKEMSIPEIIELGNYSKSNYNATPIVSVYGISPTIRENHGEIVAIIIDYERIKK